MSLRVFRDRLFSELAKRIEESNYNDKFTEGINHAVSMLDDYMQEHLPEDPDEVIKKARKLHCNDDCNIDDDAEFSCTDSGCWVSAWVYVSYGEVDEESEDPGTGHAR